MKRSVAMPIKHQLGGSAIAIVTEKHENDYNYVAQRSIFMVFTTQLTWGGITEAEYLQYHTNGFTFKRHHLDWI
eukprot:1801919-Ditylum_brightwellii.AAC.1